MEIEKIENTRLILGNSNYHFSFLGLFYSDPLLTIDFRTSTDTKLLLIRFRLFAAAAAPVLHVCSTESVTATKVKQE